MSINIRIEVSSIISNTSESQIYSNRLAAGLEELKARLEGKDVDPVIGNFPHVSGAGMLVRIRRVMLTYSEDNAGVGVQDILDTMNVKRRILQ